MITLHPAGRYLYLWKQSRAGLAQNRRPHVGFENRDGIFQPKANVVPNSAFRGTRKSVVEVMDFRGETTIVVPRELLQQRRSLCKDAKSAVHLLPDSTCRGPDLPIRDSIELSPGFYTANPIKYAEGLGSEVTMRCGFFGSGLAGRELLSREFSISSGFRFGMAPLPVPFWLPYEWKSSSCAEIIPWRATEPSEHGELFQEEQHTFTTMKPQSEQQKRWFLNMDRSTLRRTASAHLLDWTAKRW